MDEKKAFRQIAVHPDHRRISIIAVYDPCLEKVAFFIMKGHPFGLTASVFNFNRRAHALKMGVISTFPSPVSQFLR